MTNAQADAEAQAAREDAQLREFIAAADARNQAESDEQRRQINALLAEEKTLRARQQAERDALQVLSYLDQAVAAAVSAKEIAPQFVRFINGTTREQVDAQLAQARESTEEILAEVAGVAGARPQVEQPRDAQTGRYVSTEQQQPVADQRLPQGITDAELRAAQNGTLDMSTYLQLRQRLHVGQSDAGLFA